VAGLDLEIPDDPAMESPRAGHPEPHRGERHTMSVTTLDAGSSHILDNPAWAALTGPHAHFAERIGNAARYHRDVAPFYAVSDEDDPRAWVDLAALVDPGGTASVRGVTEAPEGWEVVGNPGPICPAPSRWAPTWASATAAA
jgi:hypothetical protein